MSDAFFALDSTVFAAAGMQGGLMVAQVWYD